MNVSDSHFGRHQLERMYLDGLPLAAATFSHNSSNFRNLTSSSTSWRPSARRDTIAFEAVRVNGDFDVDVFELRTPDPRLRSGIPAS